MDYLYPVKIKFWTLKKWFFLFISLCLTFLFQKSHAQNYGLEFASYNVQKDLRTGLNLNPHESYYFNTDFELSFNVSLYRQEQIFGYVLRAILNDTVNIDIQLNYMSGMVVSIVTGQKIYNFPFGTVDQKIYGGWEKFELRFELAKNKITFLREGKANPISFQFPSKVLMKFFFGVVNSGQFITTDIPPMHLKDIRLYKMNKLIHDWPLNESKGNQAYEVIQNNVADVSNPHWIKPRYSQWQLNRKFSFSGIVVSTFNDNTDEIYFLKEDSLLKYSLKSNHMKRIHFSNGRQLIYLDSRIAINNNNNDLYHSYLDTKQFLKFDTITDKWDGILKSNFGSDRNYTQHNEVFSKKDSSFYFFGGYGFYKYKNTLFRYHIPSKSFTEVVLSGDKINPRYLSAAGTSPNSDTIYILGGYGSASGDQRINPQGYKNLFLVDIRKKESKEIASLNFNQKDYCFANSLLISPDRKSFYALSFTGHKFHTWLKLIRGNFESAHFEMLGDSIPYLFEDIRSTANVYSNKNKSELVCITSIFGENNDSSYFEVYTIQTPPNLLADIVHAKHGKKLVNNLIPLTFFMFGLAILLWLVTFYWKKKSRIKPDNADKKNISKPGQEVSNIEDVKGIHKNSMFLFGGFQIFNKEGVEISHKFSPLVKELFLLIFFHTQNEGKGITTERLTQLLWFDKNSSQARNNRSVNMSKLRHITGEIEGLNLSKIDGYWKIEIESEKLSIDYLDVVKYININQIQPEKINNFLSLVRKGAFLIGTDYEWLDKIKSELTNGILDLLFVFEKSNKIDHDLQVKIADAIFIHDSLNEVALTLKYNALVAMGRHHLAKTVLEQFKVEYLSLYGEPFNENIQ